MGDPSASRSGSKIISTGGTFTGHSLRRASILVAVVLLVTIVSVLLVMNDDDELRGVNNQRVNKIHAASEFLHGDMGQHSGMPCSHDSWILFGETDSRTVRRSVISGQPAPPHQPPTAPKAGFKWAAGAILDDFAMGLDDYHDDERDDLLANNNNNYRGDSQVAGPIGEAPIKHGVEQKPGAAISVHHHQPAQVIHNASYSKTQQDLREARERLERQPGYGWSTGGGANSSSSQVVVPDAANNKTSTPPAETPASQPNVSLLSLKNSSTTTASSNLASEQHSKTNETSASSKPFGASQPEKHSIVITRHKRRAGAIASERK